MNIRHIISTIALSAGLGIAALAPVQVQAGEHRHDRGDGRYEERDRHHDRDDRRTHRRDHRHDRRHDRGHAGKHHRHARHDHYRWRHGHHGYPRACLFPQHRHYGRHGHYPHGYYDGDVHGRVHYNDPDGWGVIFKF